MEHLSLCVVRWSACALVAGSLATLVACATPGASSVSKTLLASALAVQPGSGAGCPILQPQALPAGASPGDRALFSVTGEGGCRLGPEGSSLIFSVASSSPRFLGLAEAAVVHPGDVLELDAGMDPAQFSGVSGSALEPLLSRLEALDPSFKSLKGPPPTGTRPVKELTAVSGGLLSAEGLFDEADRRPADGTWTLRMLTKAGRAASMTLAVAQTSSRDGGRSGKAEVVELRRNLQLTILPAGKSLRVSVSELELLPPDAEAETPLTLGEGDFLAWSVTLGTLSRLGSETRSSAGVAAVAAAVP